MRGGGARRRVGESLPGVTANVQSDPGSPFRPASARCAVGDGHAMQRAKKGRQNEQNSPICASSAARFCWATSRAFTVDPAPSRKDYSPQALVSTNPVRMARAEIHPV